MSLSHYDNDKINTATEICTLKDPVTVICDCGDVPGDMEEVMGEKVV